MQFRHDPYVTRHPGVLQHNNLTMVQHNNLIRVPRLLYPRGSDAAVAAKIVQLSSQAGETTLLANRAKSFPKNARKLTLLVE